jgi:hypothetical protein
MGIWLEFVYMQDQPPEFLTFIPPFFAWQLFLSMRTLYTTFLTLAITTMTMATPTDRLSPVGHRVVSVER